MSTVRTFPTSVRILSFYKTVANPRIISIPPLFARQIHRLGHVEHCVQRVAIPLNRTNVITVHGELCVEILEGFLGDGMIILTSVIQCRHGGGGNCGGTSTALPDAVADPAVGI